MGGGGGGVFMKNPEDLRLAAYSPSFVRFFGCRLRRYDLKGTIHTAFVGIICNSKLSRLVTVRK